MERNNINKNDVNLADYSQSNKISEVLKEFNYGKIENSDIAQDICKYEYDISIDNVCSVSYVISMSLNNTNLLR